MNSLSNTHLIRSIPLQPRPAGCAVPLTANQMMWWNDTRKLTQPLSIRLRAASVRILGPLNTAHLCNSIDYVIRRHESLRTRIVLTEGVPWNHVDPATAYKLDVINLSIFRDAESEAKRLAQEFVAQGIDLSIGPLFEVMLLRLSDTDHVLILLLDHIVGDGFSSAILNREIWTLYDQAQQGLPLSLPQMPLQFADYAVWLDKTYKIREERHAGYWKARMAGAQPMQLPTDPGLAEAENPIGLMLHFPFGATLTQKIRKAAQCERTLVPIVVLAAFLAVIFRWSNRNDISLLFVSHGRYHRPELQQIIGDLGHLVFFRIELTDADTLGDLLKRTHLEFVSGIEHQEFDPELLAEYRELFFNWGGLPTYSARWSAGKQRDIVSNLRIQPFSVSETWPVTFMPFFSDTPAGVVMTVNYRPDQLRSHSIQRFGENMRLFAEALAVCPESKVTALPWK
jgi:hypothetical protein